MRERGIALMLVLGFIFILGVLAAGYAASMKVEGILARKAGAQTEVEWLCRSGVEISKYILSQQMANSEEPYDSLNQSWAGGPGSTLMRSRLIRARTSGISKVNCGRAVAPRIRHANQPAL